ncbi:folylpolyglutamate synthase/dihydrofolate synthase family protein [Maritalea porphyrae]|uniref:bifunctional folylpolyglutamate synthase/dihydrofolate synthase n=1 Tax=Maritalea porphyrae TaxID=880732 RepID=UPI0022AF8790|nr:folylpolyglutamate synthase/dihydrofolate synthase family protein [Maritalea porphyrae]MCZ4271997.1 bifunctional folylpolyglutamate synthase/dihydrofolate synthase [Maritalea porphyrae]
MTRTEEITQRLLALHPKKMDLSLERLNRLLAQLDHPENQLPPVIHVAGTNGKGSTIAFMRAMLEAAGKRVHVYASPHLTHFNERFRLAGTFVDDKRLNETLERIEKINAGQTITFFEITTAVAFDLFCQVEADYVLLETGLGGRLDSTNVVPNPLGCVITPISIDHVQFLGNTIEKIAFEKAGILKSGAKAVFSRQTHDAMDVLEKRAAELGITPFICGQEFDGYPERDRFVYQDLDGLEDLPPPRLKGIHQFENASTAIAALKHFGTGISSEAIAKGMETVTWPARMQPLPGLLQDMLIKGSDLWLDGGHNVAGAQVLAQALGDLNDKQSKPLTLILGMLGNKDVEGYLSCFEGLAKRVITVPVPADDLTTNAGTSPQDLADLAIKHGFAATHTQSVQEALKLVARDEGQRVVICGSLYLAGDVLGQNKTPPQ